MNSNSDDVERIKEDVKKTAELQHSTLNRLTISLGTLFTVFAALAAIFIFIIQISGEVVEIRVTTKFLKEDFVKLEGTVDALSKTSQDFSRLAERFENSAAKIEQLEDFRRRTKELTDGFDSLLRLLRAEDPLPKDVAPTLERIERLIREMREEQSGQN